MLRTDKVSLYQATFVFELNVNRFSVVLVEIVSPLDLILLHASSYPGHHLTFAEKLFHSVFDTIFPVSERSSRALGKRHRVTFASHHSSSGTVS